MLSDLIQVVDCLTHEEVSSCLKLLEKEQWEPTTVFSKDKCHVDTNFRSNERVCLTENSKLAQIMHKGMNAALLTYRDTLMNLHGTFNKYPIPGSWGTSSWRESIQVLRYEKGQYYKWHSDSAIDKSVPEYHRTISIVLYLQNAEVGGRTNFAHRYYKPKPGQALIFPSNWCFPHEAEAVERGTKIAAVTWYYTDYDGDK